MAQEHEFTLAPCPIDMNGRFTHLVDDFEGQYVKDADKLITQKLIDSDQLWHRGVIDHSYPFCYRSNTPLLYRIIDSWYVKVTAIKDNIIKANAKVNWVPSHIKDGRFGNWLKDARDWSISRNRFWGTPIPIWQNDKTGNQICIGSCDELYQYSGIKVSDLHRENVDSITFSLPGEDGQYQRISEVLDCWFESGSMPYAQLHYPFENQALFEQGFPAEFIAEGLDQTRGWFYTLMVLSTALYDKPAFKNVIVNGMVMAKDGKKMSKSLRNFTPPEEIMEKHGADGLRMYLISGNLVKAEEMRFAEKGVTEMNRRVVIPLHNALKFFQTYAQIDHWKPENTPLKPEHILDCWIISRVNSVLQGIHQSMEAYRLDKIAPLLFEFIDDLTNWYIRLNRKRFWQEGMSVPTSKWLFKLCTTH